MSQEQQGPQDPATTETHRILREQITQHAVLLFMKGSPEQPQCGFSARASQALMACGQPFAYVDVLAEPQVRAHLPTVSEWPTFPQLFVGGELLGGSDIVADMAESGELKTLVEKAVADAG